MQVLHAATGADGPDLDGGVSVDDGVVTIEHFEERDPDVVSLLGDADRPDEALHRVLQIGARAVRAANASVDSEIVEKRFSAMSTQFDECVDQAMTSITDATEALLDADDGALTATLSTHRQQLEELLGSTFDPDSKKSVVALFEEVMKTAHEQQTEAVRRLVTDDGDDSPLARLKLDLARDFRSSVGELRGEVQALSERIAVHEAVAPVVELTSGKGFTFEDILHGCVSGIAAAHGDVADQTGNELGDAANKKGDEVVVLNREDTAGYEGRIVLEAKAKKLNMRSTIAELEAALENRSADAAIAVFSSQELAPTSVPFHYSENKAIVVLDKDGHDDAALRLAYMWARWVVRRSVAAVEGDEIDLERVGRLIEDAERALERKTAVKRFHTQAKKSIDQAAEQVTALVDEVERALEDLAAEVAA